VAREAQALELLRVDQSAGAVVLEHELVLFEDIAAQDVLLVRELIADELEHEVVGRQREADHDQAAFAGGQRELIVRLPHVAEQFPEALGLALAGPAEHSE